ncbi:hypothetical protein ACLB2K_026697 [Fragaria x ananassa]
MIWGGTANGFFSVKSAYLLSCAENGYQNYVWLKNWSMNIPPKLKIFLWTFVSSKILTNVQRAHRRLTMNSSYQWLRASTKPKLQVARHMEMLSWIKPRSGTFKLNMDGSRNRTGGIGAGGVIRDHTGVWIGDIPNLEVESDSSILINLLQGTGVELHLLETLVLNCRTLLQQFDSIQVNHIHRERNTVADILAKNSIMNAHGICYFQEPPVIVIEALLHDIADFARSKSFSSSNAG